MCKGAGFPLGPKRLPTPPSNHGATVVGWHGALMPQDWCWLSHFAERGERKEGKGSFFQRDQSFMGESFKAWSHSPRSLPPEDVITSTLCCLPLQLETRPRCLQDASKTSLSSNTLLWCLGQSVAQAKLPVQAEKRPKAEISHCQPLDVQSDMGTLVVRPPKFRESTGGPFLPVNAMGTLKTCSVWPGTGLYSGRTHPYMCIYILIHKIHMHKKSVCIYIYIHLIGTNFWALYI